ncbi:GNAT family N-acetyltransferase [Thiohalobacter sp. IOR34]|uniref:GNAT family N-acetyltransferase n=1 Tax=Thiohalobacter sp. IOR34 TaxID=3057176 RepID=UPI0025B02654|nr:GNAT family N-acetyltransferase [Thiohalobacter sp. IOR34]WJW76303.1 GNAT family N-acetyltransferase [Thiohalobacter sp. IOR34]
MRHDLAEGFRVATATEIGFDEGGYEFYQNKTYASLSAQAYGMEVLDLGGMEVFVERKPLIGITRAIVGSPELHGGSERWLETIKGLRAGSVEILTNQRCPSLDRFRNSPDDLYNFVVDLREGEDAVWKRMEKRCRQAVRRGQKGGLVIEETKSEDDFVRFHDLARRIANGQKGFRLPAQDHMKAVLRTDMSFFMVARLHGEIVGGLYHLVGRHVFGWLGILDYERSKGLPSNLMYWEGMRWAIERGYPFYDMGAQSVHRYPNLTMSKRAYRPILVPSYRYVLPQSMPKWYLVRLKQQLKQAKLSMSSWISSRLSRKQ